MIFFFKKKTLNLDFFTTRSDIYNYFPVNYSRQFLPEWYKKLPDNFQSKDSIVPKQTIKSCPGFNSFFSNGITIPMWCEVAIDPQPSEELIRWQFSDFQSTAHIHPVEQITGFVDPKKYGHMKLISPWFASCEEDVNWVFSHNTWYGGQIDKFNVLPAVLNFKYNGSTHVNLMVNRSKRDLILIESGIPLVNLIPMAERRPKVHTHLISKEEMVRLKEKKPVSFWFSNRFYKLKNISKKKEKEKKCPFYFNA